MKVPLATYRSSDDAVLLGPEAEVGAGEFFARVKEIAGALPDAPFVINLAESRIGFMLGFAATLVRGQTSLLPSGQGRGDWEDLTRQYPGASIISDRPFDAASAFDLAPYLLPGTMRKSAHDTLVIPEIPVELTAALLFTSGSTGRPTAHAKSWGQLSRGAAILIEALAWTPNARMAVVGSVPPQHMFGLEATVMLPWIAGIPVHLHKPLLPADIETAIAQCARPCWWMTTPVHLRPASQAGHTQSSVGSLAGIVSSTMSLPQALAMAAEAKWQAPVVEIYGSTETGALATRHTATEECWTPLRNVKLTPQTGGEVPRILASGEHIDTPVQLADELRIEPDGRFVWLGRSADMLKIGGKRASLASLNQRIAEIPGVDDAVYFVPDAASGAALHDDAHPARRLAAFYVSATLSPGQMTTAIRARVDPVFVPRPLLRVPRLPRNENGKISQAVLVALFSQARQDVHAAAPVAPGMVLPTHPAIGGHFPGNPIVPGVVILSHVAEAIRRHLPHIVPETLLSMRFHVPLRPGRPFVVHTELRGERIHVEVRAGDRARDLIAAGQWACHTDASPVEPV